MEQLVAVLVMAAILGAGTWVQYRRSKGRMWHPLWVAFSMTSAAILFVTAGIAGFHLDRRTAFFANSRWSDSVLWWQVGLGLIFAMLAVLSWRRGIRYTDDLLRSRPR